MRRKRRADKLDTISTKKETIRVARLARLLVRVSAGVLAIAFGWLKLRGVDFAPIAKELPADVIFQLTLAIYYICWVAGLLSDTSDQELVYVTAPNRRDAMLGGISTAVLVTGLFAVLCLR